MDASRIQKHMQVLGPDGAQVGVVDSVEGDRIKLTRKDSSDGEHHFLLLSAVESVDSEVHINAQTAETLS